MAMPRQPNTADERVSVQGKGVGGVGGMADGDEVLRVRVTLKLKLKTVCGRVSQSLHGAQCTGVANTTSVVATVSRHTATGSAATCGTPTHAVDHRSFSGRRSEVL